MDKNNKNTATKPRCLTVASDSAEQKIQGDSVTNSNKRQQWDDAML